MGFATDSDILSDFRLLEDVFFDPADFISGLGDAIESAGDGGGVGDDGGGGGGSGGGPIAVAAQATEAVVGAERTLAALTGLGESLEASVESCEGDGAGYLGCVGAELEGYAAALDEISLDLPEELRGISAVIRRASRRIAAARSVPEAVEIINETVNIVNIAILEVTEATARASADAPVLARLQVEQASAVRTALDGLGENLRVREG